MASVPFPDELAILESLFGFIIAFSPESVKQALTATQTQDIVISGAWVDVVQVTLNTDGISQFFVNFHGYFARDSNGGSSNLRIRIAIDGVAVGQQAGKQVLRQGETIPVSSVIQPLRGTRIISVQAKKRGISQDARLNADLNELQVIEV